MKINKYWVDETVDIPMHGRVQKTRIVAGSRVSAEAAVVAWHDMHRLICSRINGGGKAKSEEYESDIYEHIADEIDGSNIVTINRYGALVLNTTEYSIYDLDGHGVDWGDFTFRYWGMSRKQKIVAKFKRLVGAIADIGTDFRIYETHKGIRVIGRRYFDTKSANFHAVGRRLCVDGLYLMMCMRQHCYRARLTPKPYRMKARTIRIRKPADCLSDAYLEWAREYRAMAEKHATVRLIECIGRDFSHDAVIRYHDCMTNCQSGLPLA